MKWKSFRRICRNVRLGPPSTSHQTSSKASMREALSNFRKCQITIRNKSAKTSCQKGRTSMKNIKGWAPSIVTTLMSICISKWRHQASPWYRAVASLYERGPKMQWKVVKLWTKRLQIAKRSLKWRHDSTGKRRKTRMLHRSTTSSCRTRSSKSKLLPYTFWTCRTMRQRHLCHRPLGHRLFQ